MYVTLSSPNRQLYGMSTFILSNTHNLVHPSHLVVQLLCSLQPWYISNNRLCFNASGTEDTTPPVPWIR